MDNLSINRSQLNSTAKNTAAGFKNFSKKTEKKEKIAPVDYYSEDRTSIPQMPAPKSSWTVLAYIAGDNNLVCPGVDNLKKLEMLGSTEKTNLVSFMEIGSAYYDKKTYPQGGAKYYLVKKGHDEPTKSIVKEMGAVDSSNPEVLSEFLAWGMKNFPAENYLILFYDHGFGFRGAMLEEPKFNKLVEEGKSKDEALKQSIISIPELKSAIQNAEKKAGVNKNNVTVGFAACNMAQAEVAYELKDAAKYLIASQAPTLRNGLPLLKILGVDEGDISYSMPEGMLRMINQEQNSLKNQLDGMSPENLGRKTVDASRCEYETTTPTISFLNLSGMDGLKSALNDFSGAIISTQTPGEIIREKINTSQNFADPENTESPTYHMRDIYDLAQKIADAPEIKDASLKLKARNLVKAIKEVVIAEQHEGDVYKDEFMGAGEPLDVIKEDTTHGLSIYAPEEKEDFEKWNYQNLSFAKDTLWDEAIKKITAD